MVTVPDSANADLGKVQVAVLAKAPIPGLAKTRLIPALGAAGAARLQRQMTRGAVQCALAACLGPVTVWCAPSVSHRFFRAIHRTAGVVCLAQSNGDLGDRMHTAFRVHCPEGPLLLIGADCPALRPDHLRCAARALIDGNDAVFCAAEDGGYVLVGLLQPQRALFTGMTWSTSSVMSETRMRAQRLGLKVQELETLWDVDVPADLDRMHAQPALQALAQARACHA